VRGATSYRRVVLFHLGVSTVCTGFLLVVALTPIADEILLRMLLNLPDELVGPVKRAVIAFLPIPTFIIFRGVHQAVHITNDTPGWIGVGTILRFVVIIAFVFLIAVPRRFEGGTLGGLAFTIGIGTEMVVMVVTARKHAKFLRSDPPGVPPPTYGDLWAFCFPMFLANIMGVCMQPVTSAIVNGAVDGKTSAAAFGVLRSFVWFFSSTLFAMQAMALAKADSVRNLVRLLLFELIPVAAFTALIFVTAFFAPFREAVLVDFFEIDNEVTLEFVRETLPIALVLPLLMAMRSTVRGLILRSGKTRWVTFSNLVALLALFGVSWLGPSASAANGAAVGYVCWLGALGLELAVSLYGLWAIGLKACVTEGGRQVPVGNASG